MMKPGDRDLPRCRKCPWYSLPPLPNRLMSLARSRSPLSCSSTLFHGLPNSLGWCRPSSSVATVPTAPRMMKKYSILRWSFFFFQKLPDRFTSSGLALAKR